MKKPVFNAEKLLSISAVVVGACALTVSIFQTHIFSAQQESSVWPCVKFNVTTGMRFSMDDVTHVKTDSSCSFKINIKNKGIGPAIVEKVIIKCAGKSYNDNEFEELCRLLMKEYNLGVLDGVNSTWVSGSVLSANEDVTFFEVTEKNAACALARNYQRIAKEKDLDIEIHYQNVYGKKWVSNKSTKLNDLIK